MPGQLDSSTPPRRINPRSNLYRFFLLFFLPVIIYCYIGLSSLTFQSPKIRGSENKTIIKTRQQTNSSNSHQQLISRLWNRLNMIVDHATSLLQFLDFKILPQCQALTFEDLLNLSLVIEDKKKPTIIKAPESVATVVGQSVLLICLVEGNPAPKVQWKVSGLPLAQQQFGQTFKAPRGSVLRISNVFPIHNGAVITCTATNALGRAEASAKLTVYNDDVVPIGFPEFTNMFSVVVARTGSNTELECRTIADPPAIVKWFKDNVPVDLNNPRFILSGDGSLTISRLTDDDNGKYECAAANTKGTRLSSGYTLLIRSKHLRPHFTHVPDKRQLALPGSTLRLSCAAFGAPLPTVSWYYTSDNLQQRRLIESSGRGGSEDDHQQRRTPGTASLTLSGLINSLNVTCEATSSVGTIRHHVQIVVKDLPNIPGIPEIVKAGPTTLTLTFKPSVVSPKASPVAFYLLGYLPEEHFSDSILQKQPNVDVENIQPGFESNADGDGISPSWVKVRSSPAGLSTNFNVDQLTATVGNLRPASNYVVWSRAVGLDGDASMASKTATFTTEELGASIDSTLTSSVMKQSDLTDENRFISILPFIAPSSPPLNVKAQALSNVAVTVNWDPPIDTNGRIRAYRIYYTNRGTETAINLWQSTIVDIESPDQKSDKTDQGHLYILSHLTTNYTYHIRVSAFNSQGEGPLSDKITVIVRPGLLSTPRQFKATTNSSDKVELSWIEPEDVGQLQLLHYQLAYSSMDRPVSNPLTGWISEGQRVDEKRRISPTTTRFIVTGLKPDTNYQFSLTAVSPTGSGVEAFSAVKTRKFVPSAPTDLQIEVASSNSLRVSWLPPNQSTTLADFNEPTNRIAYYKLFWRRSNEEGGWIETNSWSVQTIQADNRLSHRDRYSTIIGGLESATFYVVRVSAVAPAGSGERASHKPVKTWDQPPEAPQGLQANQRLIAGQTRRDQVLIKLSWQPITDYRVSGYRVAWKMANNSINGRKSRQLASDWLDFISSSLTWSNLSTISDRHILNGHVNVSEPDWEAPQDMFLIGGSYEFEVAAITPVQLGRASVAKINVDTAAPTVALDVIEKHYDPDSKYFTLKWNAPNWSDRHGPFDAYELSCSSDQHSPILYRIDVENSQNDLSSQSTPTLLWPDGQVRLKLTKPDDIEVRCRMRYRNRQDAGPWSDDIRIEHKKNSTTTNVLSTPLSDVRAVEIAPNTIRVSWSMPTGLIQSTYGGHSIDLLPVKRFAVYLRSLHDTTASANWKRLLTTGPTTELLILPDQDLVEGRRYAVRVSSIGMVGDHEGVWSEEVAVEPMQSNALRLTVDRLSCHLTYRAQIDRWDVGLTWLTSQRQLQQALEDGLISHYRVNFTGSPMSVLRRPDQHSYIGNLRSEREHSLKVSSRILKVSDQTTHHLRGLRSNVIYSISVRPVVRPSSTKNRKLIGLPVTIKCPTSGSGGLSIPSPVITNDQGSRSSTTWIKFLPLKWHVNSVMAGRPEYKTVVYDLSNQDRVTFEPQLSPLSTMKAEGVSVRATDLPIPRGDSPVAIALRACFKPTSDILMTKSDVDQLPSNFCYESKWADPLPSPSSDNGDVLITQMQAKFNTDADNQLWLNKDPSELGRPPSDDASAQGPDRDQTEIGVHQNQFLTDKTDQQQEVGQRATRDDTGSKSVNTPTEQLSLKSAKFSHITLAVSLVALVLITGLSLSFLLIYRKRKRKVSVSHRLISFPPNSLNGLGHDGIKFHTPVLPVRKRRSSLFRWSLPWRSKRESTRRILNSIHLTDMPGPPPGSESVTANLNCTLGYSAGLISPSYNTADAYSIKQMNDLPTSTLIGSQDLIGHELDVASSINRYGSLRNELLPSPGYQNDNYSLDVSYNGLMGMPINQRPNDGLCRTDSLILSQPSLYHTNAAYSVSSVPPTRLNSMKLSNKREAPVNFPLSIDHNSEGYPGLTGTNESAGNKYWNASGEHGSMPIPIADLVTHVKALRADNCRFMAAEFESIDPGGEFSWEASNRAVNRSKNRYANVVAYDHTRVRLAPLTGQTCDQVEQDGSDYINANYLDGYNRQQAYIATQGPLPQTINDFWRMTWEQKSSVIVSMTRLEERARIKCEQYWPGAIFGSSGIKANRISNTSASPLTRSAIRTSVVGGDKMPPSQSGSDVDSTSNGGSNWLASATRSSTAGPTSLLGEACYGDICVRLIDTIELAYYIVRTFQLSTKGSSETREIRQLQFTAWPDHGVPNHPAPLLMFLRRVRTESPNGSGPVIVHCSAGVGRTGAVILLDMLLEQMQQENCVDVLAAVTRLRAQRNFMVQTEEQYKFVYEALIEAVASGNTELSTSQLASHWQRLTSLHPIDTLQPGVINSASHSSISGLELEFSQIVAQSRRAKAMSSTPSTVGLLSPTESLLGSDDERTSSLLASKSLAHRPQSIDVGQQRLCTGQLTANISKNRLDSCLPHDANRVCLRAIRGVDGSDYINASFVDGYQSRDAYIATQAPLASTSEDFWRMLWETGSCLIVRLDEYSVEDDLGPIREEAPPYWPTMSQSARHGFLVVDLIATYNMNACLLRELRLTDARDGSSRTVRQFDASSSLKPLNDLEKEFASQLGQASSSLSGGGSSNGGEFNTNSLQALLNQTSLVNFRQRYTMLISDMLEVVTQVHKTKEHFGMENPITVHCIYNLYAVFPTLNSKSATELEELGFL